MSVGNRPQKQTLDHINLHMFLRWMWLLLLAPLVAGAVAYGMLRQQAPTYEAEAQLLIGPGVDSPNPDLNTLRASERLMQTYKELASTDPFLAAVAEQIQYDEITPARLRNMIEVRANINALILFVTVDANDPILAVEIANTTAEAILRLSPTDPENPAMVSKEGTRLQLAKLEQVIAQSETRLTELETELNQLDRLQKTGPGALLQAPGGAQDRLEEMHSQFQAAVTVAEQTTVGSQILAEMTSSSLARVRQLETSLAETDQILQHIVIGYLSAEREHLASLQAAEIELQRAYVGQPLDGYILNAQGQVAALEEKLNSTYDVGLKRLLFDQVTEGQKNLKSAVAVAETRQKMVLDLIAQERQHLSDSQQIQVDQQNYLLEAIAGERAILTQAQSDQANLYDTLLNPWPNQVKVIQLAETAKRASSNLRLIVIMAGIAGLAAAVAFVFGLGYLDRSVKSASELEQLTNVTIIGTVRKPKALFSGKSPPGPLSVVSMPDSQESEDYRLLAANLFLQIKNIDTSQNGSLKKGTDDEANKHNRAHALLITGLYANGRAAEVAANLAVVMAQAGYRTLLIDANLHEPSLHELFDINNESGLSTILTNPAIPVDLKPNQSSSNLRVLPGGPAASNPFGLFASRSLPLVLNALKNQVNFILIAGSPLMKHAEGLAFAGQVDHLLLVSDEEKINRDQATDITRRLASFRGNIISMVQVVSQTQLIAKHQEPVIEQESPEPEAAGRESLDHKRTVKLPNEG